MKNMKIIIGVGALCLTAGAFAFMQNHLGGERGLMHRGPELRGWHHGGTATSGEAASMARHFAEGFAKVVAFDTNKDGELNAGERQALVKGIGEGKVQFQGNHQPPRSVTQSTEGFANHVADMYVRLASYDSNADGAIDSAEEAALSTAIGSGELELPGSRR